MGAKLDRTYADIAHISLALKEDGSAVISEAKKQKKYRAPKSKESRKERKQQNKQAKLYQGLPPVGPTPPARRQPSGRTTPPGTQTLPSTPIPAVVQQPRQARKLPIASAPKAKTVVTKAELKTATVAAPKPRPPATVTAAPAKKSLFQRVKQKLSRGPKPAAKPTPKVAQPKKPTVGERLKGFMKSITSPFKRLLKQDDVEIPRTIAAMLLAEQRSSTTFGACPKRSMAGTPYLRHSLPKNMFVKPDKDNPTFPIRAGCRASKAGVLRALQKDMSGADEAVVKQVKQRINSQGGTRGKDRLRAWGTGVGGRRMETYRGKPGTPMRTASLAKKLGISKNSASKLHGTSTGRPDNQKHTSPYSPPGGSKGPAGNREVTRSHLADAKPTGKKRSKGSQKRRAAREAGTIGRGKAKIGR